MADGGSPSDRRSASGFTIDSRSPDRSFFLNISSSVILAGLGLAGYFGSSEARRTQILDGFVRAVVVAGRFIRTVRVRSLIVEVCCETGESALNFFDDFESGLIAERIRKEFAEIGFTEVEVKLENYDEVKKEMEAIRQQNFDCKVAEKTTTEEKENFSRLVKLLVDKGGEAFRTAFHERLPPSTLADVLKEKKSHLEELKKAKVIEALQWELLYPASGAPDSKKFGVILLAVLLRHICDLKIPATGWDTMPPDADTSIEANIVRIKEYRNYVYKHVAEARVDDTTFESLRGNISKSLVTLGVPKNEIDELKKAPLSFDEGKYIELLKSWVEADQKLLAISQETLQTTKENQRMLNEVINKVSAICSVDGSEEGTSDLEKLKGLKVGSLNANTYIEICLHLNKKVLGKDWRSLGGAMNYSHDVISFFGQESDPANALLSHWETTRGNDVFRLIQLLEKIGNSHLADYIKKEAKK